MSSRDATFLISLHAMVIKPTYRHVRKQARPTIVQESNTSLSASSEV